MISNIVSHLCQGTLGYIWGLIQANGPKSPILSHPTSISNSPKKICNQWNLFGFVPARRWFFLLRVVFPWWSNRSEIRQSVCLLTTIRFLLLLREKKIWNIWCIVDHHLLRSVGTISAFIKEGEHCSIQNRVYTRRSTSQFKGSGWFQIDL